MCLSGGKEETNFVSVKGVCKVCKLAHMIYERQNAEGLWSVQVMMECVQCACALLL